MNKNHLCGVLIGILFMTLFAENGWRENEMEIFVYLQDRKEAQQLQSLNLIGDVYPADAYPEDVRAGAIGRMYVTPDELEKIRACNLSYEILIENLNEHYEDFWNAKQGYTSCDDIFKRIDKLEQDYPTLCKKSVWGKSVGARDLSALKISDNVSEDENEPEMMFDAGIHGDEVGGPENAIMFAEDLCKKYGQDTRITQLLDTREVWIYVMVNPDGRVRNTRYNANGIDCNRNYGYMATNGFSEPETRGVRDCILDNQFAIQITYHSGMIALLYPWCRVPTAIPDKNKHIFMAETYEAASDYGTIRIVQSYNDYQTTGETIEFAYGAAGNLILTMEISVDKHPSDIMGYYNKSYDAMIEMIEYAGYGVEGTITNATTGDPVGGVIFINDFFPNYADPVVGDYHKFLNAGSYTMRVFANGYTSTTVSNVSVQEKNSTVKDIALEPDNASRSTWAYKVVFTEVGSGHTFNALGSNDNVSFTTNSGSVITFDMQFPIKNITGTDFKVYATDANGNYTFKASNTIDGPWKELGTGTGTNEFDLEEGSVTEARYIQIDGRCAIDAIEALWDTPTPAAVNGSSYKSPLHFNVTVSNKRVMFNVNNTKPNTPYTVRVYDTRGKLQWESFKSHYSTKQIWQPASTGIYVGRLESGKDVLIKRFSVVH